MPITNKVPAASEIYLVSEILPLFQEMLDYCGFRALDHENGLAYDADLDQVVYHLKILDEDRELFPWLRQMEEIWIVQRGGGVSN